MSEKSEFEQFFGIAQEDMNKVPHTDKFNLVYDALKSIIRVIGVNDDRLKVIEEKIE